MAEEVDLDQLNLLHPKLRPYVKVLLTHEFGLLRDLPQIHSIQCGSLIRKDQICYGDRFQLKILYCRKALNWHVLMNGNDVTRAPDFIMDENFLAGATPELIKTKVPSLANWCPSNVRCLLNVVLELLQLYKSHQINQLRMNQNLYRYLFEYDTLLSMAGISEDDIEVYVQVRNPVVTFLVHLEVDFSKLPIALPDSNDLAVLIVEFKENAKSTIQLSLRYELEETFGVELPDLSPDISLMDYIPGLESQLKNRVEKVINQTHQRKMLYSYLVQFFEPSLINGDNINFRNVSFLLEVDGLYFVLNVNIPLDYPESRPDLRFLAKLSSDQSVYSDFKYNEKMSPREVARSIYNTAVEFARSKCNKQKFS